MMRCRCTLAINRRELSCGCASSGGDCIPTPCRLPRPRPASPPHPPSFRRSSRDAPISRRVRHRDRNRARTHNLSSRSTRPNSHASSNNQLSAAYRVHSAVHWTRLVIHTHHECSSASPHIPGSHSPAIQPRTAD